MEWQNKNEKAVYIVGEIVLLIVVFAAGFYAGKSFTPAEKTNVPFAGIGARTISTSSSDNGSKAVTVPSYYFSGTVKSVSSTEVVVNGNYPAPNGLISPLVDKTIIVSSSTDINETVPVKGSSGSMIPQNVTLKLKDLKIGDTVTVNVSDDPSSSDNLNAISIVVSR